MRTGSGRFGTGGPRDGSGARRRADIYSDESLMRARYEAAALEARFWENFAWLKPFAVSTSTRVMELPPVPPRKPPPVVVEAVIPTQRARPDHPAVAELTERVLRMNNKGGRA